MEENKQSSFQIKDRRRFNTDGSIREGSEPEEIAQPTLPPPPSQAKQEPKQASRPSQPREPGEIDFQTFLMSLASSIQINLGLIPHPATRKPEINLTGAKQTIDILALLEEKTKGNLDENEDHLLKQILFELRMQYVELINQMKEAQKGPSS